MNRFLKSGGAMAREIYGYIVPDDAETYDDWQKDPEAAPIIQEAAKRLRATLNCSAVADWLNSESVPVGPYCQNKKWDGKMVRQFFEKTVLKGRPGRGFKTTVKHHETGRRVAVKNPKGPKFIECPGLAHLEPDEFDALNLALAQQNAGLGRKPVNGEDPLLGRPRKRTVFPGQHARCWYCGRQCVWGGNGMTENLMCAGARDWLCWNSIGFPGALARQAVIEAITTRLYQLDAFEAQFGEMVKAAGEAGSGGLSERWTRLLRAEEHLKREQENLKATMKAFGPVGMVQEAIAELEAKEKELSRERRLLEKSQTRRLDLPESLSQLRDVLTREFDQQAAESPEFGDLLRKMIPEFHVFLVRLCDGGHLLPRAKVKLDLAGSFEDVDRVPGLRGLLSQDLTFDLFRPPQREQIRVEAVKLAAQKRPHRQIAQMLPGKPTATAVSNALALHRKMQELGLASPYVVVEQPPDDYSKLRRHRNGKYHFTPLDGYIRPAP
jgi:hypothetical protein